jgi:hypothetical protein
MLCCDDVTHISSWQRLPCLHIVKFDATRIYTTVVWNKETHCLCLLLFLLENLPSIQFNSVQFSFPPLSFESNQLWFSDMHFCHSYNENSPLSSLYIYRCVCKVYCSLELRMFETTPFPLTTDVCERAVNESVPEGARSSLNRKGSNLKYMQCSELCKYRTAHRPTAFINNSMNRIRILRFAEAKNFQKFCIYLSFLCFFLCYLARLLP